jgi:hypothetical protein
MKEKITAGWRKLYNVFIKDYFNDFINKNKLGANLTHMEKGRNEQNCAWKTPSQSL